MVSYPGMKQGLSGELYITFTHYRHAINYVCVEEFWVNADVFPARPYAGFFIRKRSLIR